MHELISAVGAGTLDTLGLDTRRIARDLAKGKLLLIYVGCGHLVREAGEASNLGAELRKHVELLACLLAARRHSSSVGLTTIKYFAPEEGLPRSWQPSAAMEAEIFDFWLVGAPGWP